MLESILFIAIPIICLLLLAVFIWWLENKLNNLDN